MGLARETVETSGPTSPTVTSVLSTCASSASSGVRSPGAAHDVAAAFADYDHDGRVDIVAGGVTARVAVKTGELIQFEDITGGSSRASQSELSVRFGRGPWSGAEWVAALWPDGRRVVVRGVPGNQAPPAFLFPLT